MERGGDGDDVVEIERNEIIRVKLRDGSGDSRLPVRLVSEPGLMAEFGLRLSKKRDSDRATRYREHRLR